MGALMVREWLNTDQGFFYRSTRLLERQQTAFQLAELLETPALGKVLLLDGITQVAEHGEYRYHEPMVHPAMLTLADPRQVLVIGGGDGGILREVLLYPAVQRVDFVELDEAVVEFARQHLGHVHAGAFDDPRVRCHFADGRAFVESTTSRYDTIIMDMTDPAGPACRLYTREFFSAVRRCMNEAAIFVMHGESPMARPAAFACIERTLQAVFPATAAALTFVPMYATLWSFRYAGSSLLPNQLSPADLAGRIAARLAAEPRLVNPACWPALFAPDPCLTEAARHPLGRIITDDSPDFPDAFSASAGD